MTNILLGLLLFFTQYCIGRAIVEIVKIRSNNTLFQTLISLMFGIFFSVPCLYIIDILSQNNLKITYGMFISIALLSSYVFFLKHKKTISIRAIFTPHFDYLVLFLLLVISSYIMHKTFRTQDEALVVASNLVFDFGHNISIIRSFSWGDNVPYLSPFVSGAVDIYHFFFYYWTGFIERLGLSIGYALNITSIISFTLLLMIVYYFPIILMRSKKIVGLVAVIFVLSHSTLTWWFYLQKYSISLSALWNIPTYMFAAPYDGSAISIYHTLNVYVNQRHLAFPLAFGLMLFICVILSLKNKQSVTRMSILAGISIGLMPYWHVLLTLAFGYSIGLIYLLYRKWQSLSLFILLSSFIGLIELLPWIMNITYSSVSTDISTINSLKFSSEFSVFYRFFVNYGIALITVPVGIYFLRKSEKLLLLPFLFLVLGAYGLKILMGSELDQKFLNLFLILFAIVSSHGLAVLWTKSRIFKVISIIGFILYIPSGFIDFMVIKNDFMYRIPYSGKNELIQWIHDSTPPKSTFISYADIFDPVSLAGRRNYWGFFRNFGQPDRTKEVPILFNETAIDNREIFQHNNIQYVLFPLKPKDNYSYIESLPLFKEKFPIVYEDKEIIIFDVSVRT